MGCLVLKFLTLKGKGCKFLSFKYELFSISKKKFKLFLVIFNIFDLLNISSD